MVRPGSDPDRRKRDVANHGTGNATALVGSAFFAPGVPAARVRETTEDILARHS